MLDLLGQTINVGDLVVGGTNSSFTNYGKPHVVTRIGSTQDVQLNGSAYAKAKLLVVVSQQYAWHAGDDACYALRTEYADKMNHENVPEPKSQTRYVVCKVHTPYHKPEDAMKPEFWILEVKGKNEGLRLRYFHDQYLHLWKYHSVKHSYGLKLVSLNGYLSDKTYPPVKKYRFGSVYGNLESMSSKTLKSLGLSEYVGQLINTEHPMYATLQALDTNI